MTNSHEHETWRGVAILLQYLKKRGPRPKKDIIADFFELQESLQEEGFLHEFSFKPMSQDRMRSREIDNMLSLCHSANFIEENGGTHTYQLSDIGEEQVVDPGSPLRSRLPPETIKRIGNVISG